MYLTTLAEPGENHFNRVNHLVFVIINAESHGLTRITPETYTCECGEDLTPEVLDEGDKSKTSWPNCKSWRTSGREKCPFCDNYPSIGREQHIRARGYEPTPKNDIKSTTKKQRERAIENQDGECRLCNSSASYVKRIVPPRYGGNREQVNLVTLCEHHYSDFGHQFVDLFFPEEWYKIEDISWREEAERIRKKYAEDGVDSLTRTLDDLLEKGQPKNPYPYIKD
jgi:hypothetical protein